MRKIVCSAKIENASERKAVMAWVRTVANEGYSEIEDVITLAYASQDDPDDSSRFWGIIHFFEQYPIHSIEQVNS